MSQVQVPPMREAPIRSKAGMFITEQGRNLLVPFLLVCTLFLLWGFCNGMIDVMDKHFQDELHLSKSQSAWVQFAHYLGYFLMSMPAGWLATKLGYKGGIITGLIMVAIGGFWFIPATWIHAASKTGSVSPTVAFIGFLVGVCGIATGLTFLETIANPYTTLLGSKRDAATRINLAQTTNGFGSMCGPIVGSMFFYAKDAAGHSTGSQRLYIPYLGIAIVVLVLAVIFYFADIPEIKNETSHESSGKAGGKCGAKEASIWSRPHFVLAIAAQFFYVAAQAGIFSFFINYMTSETPAIPAAWNTASRHGWFEESLNGLRLSDMGASQLAAGGAVLFLVGRFTGSILVKFVAPHLVLGFFAIGATVASALVFMKLGWVSVTCVFLSYYFMSIMFPTIFALGIADLGSKAKSASSFLVMAIMGGALLPKVMGSIADQYDMSRAFIVPLLCFVFIAFYGLTWPRWSRMASLSEFSPGGGH